MRYFPILDELFSSDSVIFLLIGLLPAFFAGRNRKAKSSLTGAAVSLAVYGICEFLSRTVRSYLLQMLALILGTAALGGAIGSLTAALVTKNK